MFCQCLKISDITPIYKKSRNDQKENYRSVSILPNLSKILERCIFKQTRQFFESILSNQQCGFHKVSCTQKCLLVLPEKWKRSFDRGKAFGALLTDVSKTFDCLDHELNSIPMDPVYPHSDLFMILCQIGNKEQKLTVFIVNS